MKLYQFLLLFTFCSVLINAYSINSDGDIPLPENLRKCDIIDKEELKINIPWKGDKHVTNCRYRHRELKAYCDIKDSNLYVIIPIIEIFGEIKDDINITEWAVCKKYESTFNLFGSDFPERYAETNEIMETGAFESIEVGDNYHGQYFFELEGDDYLYIQLFYDKIIIGEY